MNLPARLTLTLTGDQHRQLRAHLYPGDGLEAVAILLCGRRAGARRHRLLARELCPIAHGVCSERTRDRVTWPPEAMEELLEHAAREKLSVVKVHSHPTGYRSFSPIDDEGDRRLLPMVSGWVDASVPHGSAIMLPDGEMFGRVSWGSADFEPLDAVDVVGDDLHFWHASATSVGTPNFVASHAQIFDDGTIERLGRLSVAVVGCSGTGSPVIEQLVRLGVGELVLVDDDVAEERNVNRILHVTLDDAKAHRLKVDVLAEAISRIGVGTRVVAVPRNLWDPDAVRQVAQCDVVFGCMDTIDGRFLLNTLATYYSLAYFDLGVRIDAVREGADRGRIREVCGTVHYLQPGRSSLLSRGLITTEQVAAAGLRRNDPVAYVQQTEEGYIAGVVGHRPAVISVNMLAASLAVNELLARLHPFREEDNCTYASTSFSLSSMELIPDPEGGTCRLLEGNVGHGDVTPLLGLVDLAERRKC